MKQTKYSDKQRADIVAFCDRTGQANPFNGKASAPVPQPSQITKRKREKTRTELQFEALLNRRVSLGEIKRFVYEGVRLKWGEDLDGNAMHYKPDFAVFENDGSLTLVEVKNKQIWSRDLVRFRGCKSDYPEFHFELWQLRAGEWRRVM